MTLSIVEQFPELKGHEDMVEFILQARKVFKLQKTPFELHVGTWSSGSIKKYYQYLYEQPCRCPSCKRDKIKPKRRWK